MYRYMSTMFPYDFIHDGESYKTNLSQFGVSFMVRVSH